MLLDLSRYAIRLRPNSFPGAIVVIVSDSSSGVGSVLTQASISAPSEDLVPTLVTTQVQNGKELIYRGFCLNPKGSQSFAATSFDSQYADRRRVVRLVYAAGGFFGSSMPILSIDVMRNDPAKEKGNHVLELPSDYNSKLIPPYLTWETINQA